MTMKSFHIMALMLGVAAVLMAVAIGCGRRTTPISVQNVGYVGNAVCAECHMTEYRLHQRTRHATTMTVADPASLGRNAPPIGDIVGSDLVLKQAGAGYVMVSKSDPSQSLQLQFALGSGKYGQTYICILGDDSLAELHATYQPHFHMWFPTPGQGNIEGIQVGRVYSGRQARRCVSCHSTALPPNGLRPAAQFYGVGCEACHGPGQAHVEAVRAGNLSDLHMEKLGQLGAARINELCGRCHRLAKDVKPGQPATERFQAYRLMKSRCFLESVDTLSCLTCHNPHRDASTDTKHYEQVCLSCHPTKPPTYASGPQSFPRKPCPVNPRSGCVACHMPVRQLSPAEPVSMADHFIRVVRQDD